MQQAFGLNIPQTLDDICDPTRLALVVYDMQVGIVKQIENGQQITRRVLQVVEAARKARIRIFFTRHMSLAMEIGIEPTVRQGADLGYVPVVIKDACGCGHCDAAERSIASLEFAGDALITNADTFCTQLRRLMTKNS